MVRAKHFVGVLRITSGIRRKNKATMTRKRTTAITMTTIICAFISENNIKLNEWGCHRISFLVSRKNKQKTQHTETILMHSIDASEKEWNVVYQFENFTILIERLYVFIQ